MCSWRQIARNHPWEFFTKQNGFPEIIFREIPRVGSRIHRIQISNKVIYNLLISSKSKMPHVKQDISSDPFWNVIVISNIIIKFETGALGKDSCCLHCCKVRRVEWTWFQLQLINIHIVVAIASANSVRIKQKQVSYVWISISIGQNGHKL